MTTSPTPITQLLVFDGFDDLDTVGPLEVLSDAGLAPRLVRPPGSAPELRSAHGLLVTVADQLSAEAAPELLLVPGGGWRDGAAVGVRAQTTTELPALLAALHADGTVLASVCTGAMLLAAAGVVTGRPMTTNPIALDDLSTAGADVRREARVVDDGSVVSCGAPAAGLDLALHLGARCRGRATADAVAAAMQHTPVGPVVAVGAAA